MDTRPTICLSDDRASDGIGLRLAAASVRAVEPQARLVVHCAIDDKLTRDVLGRMGGITVLPPPPERSWNGKPSVILAQLKAGASEVWWLDSDMIVANPFVDRYRAAAAGRLIVASEAWSGPTPQGAHLRCSGWGWAIGRSFRRTLNSSVLRFLPQHRPLALAWQETLDSDQYVRAQHIPLVERPLHVIGDQEPLNALLASERFADVPVHVLETGTELIHAGHALSYSFGERLRGIWQRSNPCFIHAGGGRPWRIIDHAAPRGRKGRLSRLMQELSDYVIAARALRKVLIASGDHSMDAWADYRTPLGTAMRFAGFGNRSLRGLPVTAAATLIRRLKPPGHRGPAGW